MYLTTKELANHLKKHPRTIHRWRCKKWIEGIHYRVTPGGWLEFKLEAIEAYLNTPIAKRKPKN
ncbi:helix-turn-helix domain-containing protein [Planktothricoides raciborskii]|uniref:helix-turn-helix domain-containing protein n=1 Tax=Planktothricoides raciborskii TaxID=132608 RepID=UPI00339C5BDF